jgi:uroporphyrinogen-III synthase
MTHRLPLEGVRVVVTRARHQAAETLEAFRAVGAEAVELPLLEVVPVAPGDSAALREAIREAFNYDWIALTSANAARAFLPCLLTGGQHGGALEPGVDSAFRPSPGDTEASRERAIPRIATVGGATAEAVRGLGFEVALVAEAPRAEGLLAALLPHLQPGDRILLPQADDARPTLAEGLRAAGHGVTVVTAYTKDLPPDAPARARELFLNGPLGWVTFTSPRTVEAFVALLEDLLQEDWSRRQAELRALSIGPVTSSALRRHGIEPAAEAEEPSSAGLVGAMVRGLARDATAG